MLYAVAPPIRQPESRDPEVREIRVFVDGEPDIACVADSEVWTARRMIRK